MAAELDAQTAADQIVGATALDPGVGGDRRDQKPGEGGDELGAQHDDDGIQNPGLADHLAEAQEHDHPEDCQRAGRENPAEGAEFFSGGFLARNG
jgi:hypothetical protein